MFRREQRNQQNLRSSQRGLPAGQRHCVRLHAVFIPGVTLVGNVATVGVLVVGGIRVADGGLDLGVLTAFLLYLKPVLRPMRGRGYLLQLTCSRPRRPGRSLPSWRARRRCRSLSPRPLPQPARGEVVLESVEFGTCLPRRAAVRSCTSSIWTSRRADGGARRCDWSRQDHHRQASSPASTTPRPGWCASTASTCATSPTPTCARPSSWSRRKAFCSRGRWRTTSPSAVPPQSRDEVEDASPGRGRACVHRHTAGGLRHRRRRKRGGRLSAGQRQLVRVREGVPGRPSVLILDEATSSLDVPTERAVQRALRTVLRDRTALIIAHRLRPWRSPIESWCSTPAAWSRTARRRSWRKPPAAGSRRCTNPGAIRWSSPSQRAGRRRRPPRWRR